MITLIFPYDYIVMTILLLIILFSLWKGFIQSILGLFAWLGSILITIYSYDSFANFLSKQILKIKIFQNYEYFSTIISIVIAIPIIFLISLFILKKVRKIISSDIDKQILGKVFDKILGTMYGAVFSYLVLTALLIMLERYKFENINYWLNNNSNIILAVNEFNKNPIIKSVLLLKELNKNKYAKDFLKHLAILNIENGSEILAGKLAIKIGRYDYSIQIAKQASYEKRFHNEINYPVIKTSEVVNKKKMPKSELILAVIRQESEFDQKAHSYAGARGMMQLMTYTAKLIAKQAKLPYSKNRLKTDPIYNIKLGSYYLTELLEEYEGSYPFALAAYNAGPKRVKYWKKINGNPQKGKIDYVDWIELVKFKETRNYIQRVLENVNVYRYMLNGTPTKIYNFFEDKAHY